MKGDLTAANIASFCFACVGEKTFCSLSEPIMASENNRNGDALSLAGLSNLATPLAASRIKPFSTERPRSAKPQASQDHDSRKLNWDAQRKNPRP